MFATTDMFMHQVTTCTSALIMNHGTSATIMYQLMVVFDFDVLYHSVHSCIAVCQNFEGI